MSPYQFGGPEGLVWKRDRQILLSAYIPGVGFIDEFTKRFMSPPREEELISHIEQVKSLSKKNYAEKEEGATSIFLVMRFINPKTSREITKPIIEYFNGEIEEYCRPPWRDGPGSL